MPGRIVRTQTAERVAELLGSRDGRAHLSAYGWAQGMPVVMTVPTETVNDVMGLVSMHGKTALVAMIHPDTNELHFIHVCTPNQALRVVEIESEDITIFDLFNRAQVEGTVTFRVKYWQYSAVAHPIPVHQTSHGPFSVHPMQPIHAASASEYRA